MSEQKVSRRGYMKYVGGIVVVAVVAAAGYGIYQATLPPPTTPSANFIPYVNKSRGALFWVSIEEALQKAVQAKGYEYEGYDANGDAVLFNQQLETLAGRRPLAVTCNPIDSNAQAAAIAKVRSMKIPVGVCDTPSTATYADITVVFDNFKGGQRAGLKAVELLEEKYGSLDGLRILTLYGFLGSDAWRARMEGFDAVMADHPEVIYEKLPMTDETGSADVAARSADVYLSKHPDTACINFASEGPWLEGVLRAMEGKGLLYHRSDPKHILMTGVDGYPNTFRRIVEGVYDVSSVQDPLFYGEVCGDIITEYFVEKKVEKLPDNYVYEKTEKYYFGKGGLNEPCGVTWESWGPVIYQPGYIITEENVSDPRHWGTRVVIEFKKWDPITETSYKIQGVPPEGLPEWQKLFGFSAPDVRPSWA